MGIESYYTLQTRIHAAEQNGNGKAMPAQVQGIDFINMILTQMLEQQKAETQFSANAKVDVPLDSDNPALAKNPKLDIAALLAANPEIEEYVKNHISSDSSGLTIEQQIAQTLALNQNALDGAIAPLTDNIITTENVGNGSPRLLQTLMVDTEKDRKGLMNNLSLILDKLKRLEGEGGIILTNLTPEQITALKNKISALLAKHDGDVELSLEAQHEEDLEIADIMLGLIRILPPQSQPEVIVLPHGLVITPRQLQVTGGASVSKPANDLSAKLNDLVVGEDATSTPGENEDLTNLLKEFSNKKTPNLPVGNQKPAGSPDVSAGLSSLLNLPFGQDGSMQTSASFDEILAATSPINGPATYTNAAVHSARAGAALPAVQMVAVSLQKAAGDGQNKNLILQLDPPELGRIEVRLSFGKDKAIKAVVATERSETFTMLQRDSFVLERALNDVGLDANGGLSFEMAGDGYFDQNTGHDGSGGSHGNSMGNNEEIAEIESKMTWYVDPDSGLTRYSLLV